MENKIIAPEVPYVHDLDFAAWAKTLENRNKGSTVGTKNDLKGARQATAKFLQAIKGNPPKRAHEAIRVLIAGGIVKWAEEAKKGRLTSTVANPNFPEFLSFILWPVISAPRLPKDWVEALYEMSSVEITELVSTIRSKYDKREPTELLVEMTREFHDLNFKRGLENLMSDLSDPRRGGPAFLALSHANGATSHNSAHQTLKTLGVMATSGVVGTAAWDGLSTIASDLEANASKTLAEHASAAVQGHASSSTSNHTSSNNTLSFILVEHVANWISGLFSKI